MAPGSALVPGQAPVAASPGLVTEEERQAQGEVARADADDDAPASMEDAEPEEYLASSRRADPVVPVSLAAVGTIMALGFSMGFRRRSPQWEPAPAEDHADGPYRDRSHDERLRRLHGQR